MKSYIDSSLSLVKERLRKSGVRLIDSMVTGEDYYGLSKKTPNDLEITGQTTT